MKLKKKISLQESRTEKLIIPGNCAELLDSYATYYLNTYEDVISTNELIVEMLTAFMKADRDFMKVLKESKSETQPAFNHS